MSNQPANTEAEAKSKTQPWSHRKGVVDAASIKENDKGGIDAIVKSEGGKEYAISTYRHSAHATDKIRAAAESGQPHTFSGDLLGRGETLKIGVRNVTGPAIPEKEKAAKNEKAPAAEKPELSDEEKAARAEARAAGVAERDKTRIPVPADFDGDTVVVDGNDVEVTRFGTEFEVTEADAESLKKRFGEEFEVGSKVKYASFAAPEAGAAPEGP